jgi:hypothetical protein
MTRQEAGAGGPAAAGAVERLQFASTASPIRVDLDKAASTRGSSSPARPALKDETMAEWKDLPVRTPGPVAPRRAQAPTWRVPAAGTRFALLDRRPHKGGLLRQGTCWPRAVPAAQLDDRLRMAAPGAGRGCAVTSRQGQQGQVIWTATNSPPRLEAQLPGLHGPSSPAQLPGRGLSRETRAPARTAGVGCGVIVEPGRVDRQVRGDPDTRPTSAACAARAAPCTRPRPPR